MYRRGQASKRGGGAGTCARARPMNTRHCFNRLRTTFNGTTTQAFFSYCRLVLLRYRRSRQIYAMIFIDNLPSTPTQCRLKRVSSITNRECHAHFTFLVVGGRPTVIPYVTCVSTPTHTRLHTGV